MLACPSVISLEGRSAPSPVSDSCQITLTIVARTGRTAVTGSIPLRSTSANPHAQRMAIDIRAGIGPRSSSTDGRRGRCAAAVPCCRRAIANVGRSDAAELVREDRPHAAPIQAGSTVSDHPRVVVAPGPGRQCVVSTQPSRPSERRSRMGAGQHRRTSAGAQSHSGQSRVAADGGPEGQWRSGPAQCSGRDRATGS